MDVTNPGLVNVADQASGNPSTVVDSLAIPEDSDVLVPVADEGHPRAEDVTATGNSSGPTPTSANPIDQPPASPPLSLAQLPGIPPAFAPFPQTNIANTVDSQQSSQGRIQPPSFDVIGVGPTIQTNQTSETSRAYTVTVVRDANGGPVIDPAPPITGLFSDVFNGIPSKLIFLSPSPLPPALATGVVVTVAGASVPAYNAPQTVLDTASLSGTYTDANQGNPGGTVTTFSSLIPLPPGLVDGLPITIVGVNPYGGTRKAVSNVTSLDGTFTEIDDAGGGHITVVSSSPLPPGLIAGKIVKLGGAYAGAGALPAGSVINDTDAIASVSDPGGGKITIHSAHPLPADIVSGQVVTLSGTSDYDGTYAISNVTANTFDVTAAFVSDEAGTWTAYTFNLPTAFVSSYAGSWTCHTFDLVVNFSGTANGGWTSYTFTVPGTFAGNSSGSFTVFVNPPEPTSVFKLFVLPADLQGFGVSMLGREIAFAKDTLTAQNQGATRFISGYGPDFITIDKTEFADPSVPILADPNPGDVFTLSVQRQGAEVTTESFGSTTDVTILPSPSVNVPNVVQSLPSEGPIAISTGPQPGSPIITGGVQVPTATTVNVADQASSVGLPANIYV